MRVGIVACGWLGLVLAGCACAEPPVSTTVCELMDSPDRFSGRLVSIRAEAVLGFETQALVDGQCADQRMWFELDSEARDGEFRIVDRAWKKSELNLRRKVIATFLGRFETGSCFGHNCFSRSLMVIQKVQNVVATERRLAKDFSPYDCELLQREAKVYFKRGHMDNKYMEPIAVPSSAVILIGPDSGPVVDLADPIVQVAVTSKKLRVFRPHENGVIRLRGLAPGAYVFAAVANGFQSVSGCLVIPPGAAAGAGTKIELPLGV